MYRACERLTLLTVCPVILCTVWATVDCVANTEKKVLAVVWTWSKDVVLPVIFDSGLLLPCDQAGWLVLSVSLTKGLVLITEPNSCRKSHTCPNTTISLIAAFCWSLPAKLIASQLRFHLTSALPTRVMEPGYIKWIIDTGLVLLIVDAFRAWASGCTRDSVGSNLSQFLQMFNYSAIFIRKVIPSPGAKQTGVFHLEVLISQGKFL